MTLLPHNTLQEQVAMGVTLMMLEGVLEGDQSNLFKNISSQHQNKDCLCMPITLDFNASLPGDVPIKFLKCLASGR